MVNHSYFLVNDTRYDNHHGGLTVVRNLHAAMAARGWSCNGSLPVSATSSHLARVRRQLGDAHLVIVNGEGSLHHNRRNARRLLDICLQLQQSHPVAIINALWQDNDAARWKPALKECTAVYARDRRSRKQLVDIGIEAGYAPDLTFYDCPHVSPPVHDRYACTDSVIADWTDFALAHCKGAPDMDFVTLFTRRLAYTRGTRDLSRRIKYAIYPALSNRLRIRIPARYRALCHATDKTSELLTSIASARAICVARYHALCFALQQNRPFVAVPSNSHKSEALLEEVGLPHDIYLYRERDGSSLRAALGRVADQHGEVEATISEFNQSARERIDAMFDAITNYRQE
jgi:polysaccharide pyruvyl transferase WcaK-like protein